MPTGPASALLRVRVHLADSNPEIWRLIEINADLALDKVHEALQIVMGWEDAHLHDFEDRDPHASLESGQPEPRRWGPAFLREDDDAMLAEEDYPLRDVLTEEHPLFYEYDLGDRWIHQLTLIETLPITPIDNAVTVIRGDRRCPLEDSGSIHGYEELLNILTDPADEEYHGYAEWVSGMTGQPVAQFDPAAFDKNATNRALRKHFPILNPSER